MRVVPSSLLFSQPLSLMKKEKEKHKALSSGFSLNQMSVVLTAGGAPALETAPPTPAHASRAPAPCSLRVSHPQVTISWLEIVSFSVTLKLRFCCNFCALLFKMHI